MLEALAAAGIDDHYYDLITDRGDGVLVLVPPRRMNFPSRCSSAA
jgi:hypothetical protein